MFGNEVGLSPGMVPSELIRRIFPSLFASDCEFEDSSVLTSRNIEFSVWSKMYGAAVVVRCAEILEVENHHFTARNGNILIRCCRQ